MIGQKWPSALFEVSRGEDPEGIYLTVIVDIDDTDAVMDLVIDRLLEMQIEQYLPVYVSPVRPLKRVLEEMRRQQVGARGTDTQSRP